MTNIRKRNIADLIYRYYLFTINKKSMEKLKLNNGVTVVFAPAKERLICVSINVGHVNEPKLGIAALYENVLMKQVTRVQMIYGGNITSLFTPFAKDELEQVMAKIANLIKKPNLGDDLIAAAAYDIVRHTRDMAPLVERQMKLLYKHTAFRTGSGKEFVWDTDSYVRAVESYRQNDLREFADRYYTGKNMVIVISGEVNKKQVKEWAEQYFGAISAGERNRVKKHIYTGGYAQLSANGAFNQVMMGWDVTDIKNSPAANVMMSMLAKRLERSFNEVELVGGKKIFRQSDARVEVKIAGYYGLRTLRISVVSAQLSTNEIIDVICKNIVRLTTTEASDRRMETSRQWALTEKLWLFSQPQPAAVEISWQFFGRNEDMYDINTRLNYIADMSAHEVMLVARDIFSVPLTMVVYTNQPHYTYKEVTEKLTW